MEGATIGIHSDGHRRVICSAPGRQVALQSRGMQLRSVHLSLSIEIRIIAIRIAIWVCQTDTDADYTEIVRYYTKSNVFDTF